MPKFIADFFPNVANYWDIFKQALQATYQMFFIAGLITLLIGGAFGISLIVTKTDGIKPNRRCKSQSHRFSECRWNSYGTWLSSFTSI